MNRIKSWLLNDALAMFLALQLALSALGFVLGLAVPSKKKIIAFIPALVVLCSGAVELAAYTLKQLRK